MVSNPEWDNHRVDEKQFWIRWIDALPGVAALRADRHTGEIIYRTQRRLWKER